MRLSLPSLLKSPTQSKGRFVLADYYALALVLAMLIIVFSLGTRHFFSPTTFQTIANQVPSLVLLATGVTFVIICAGIDLSVGAVLGFCGAALGVGLAKYHWPMGAALAASAGVGLLCGAFNGVVSIRWGLPTVIVTLGMMEIARGAAHFITQSQTQYVGAPIEFISEPVLLGLSIPFYASILFVIVAQLVLSRTAFGHYLIAIGANEEAVRLSGVDPRPFKLAAFLISGLLVALAAIIDTSRFQSANPNAGTGIELQVVAAVVIGGASLMGGRGSFLGSFMGVLIIAVLNSGLASMGARDENKRFISGLVIVAAVILDQYRHRLTQQAAMIRQMVQRDAIQQERSRLARELHDTLQQELSGIALQLDAVDAQLSEGKADAKDLLSVAKSMVRHSQTEARHAVWNLRSPELANQDLPTAIAEMASQVRKEHTLDVQWRVRGTPFRLSGIVENHLFRIAQEAMTNTVKHAQASTILLDMEFLPGRVRLRIEDDGHGFDPAQVLASPKGHFGLLGMRERARKIAGDIRFLERSPTGSCVEVHVAAPPDKEGVPPHEQ